MSSAFPASARAVVIGCGIVGNSLAYHLTRLGWTDVVQIDKGPLPNPGGSTGHASNFIFPVDHSKEMTQLTLESQRQYVEMGVNTECGGIEVARTEERMEELRRRTASAKSWGVDSARLVTPAEIKELVPFIDESILLGGFYCPTVVGRRLAPRGDDHARAGDGERRPPGLRQHGRVAGWTSRAAASVASTRAAARSRPRPSSSPAASGARCSRGWRAPTSRSRRPCTR